MKRKSSVLRVLLLLDLEDPLGDKENRWSKRSERWDVTCLDDGRRVLFAPSFEMNLKGIIAFQSP